MTVVLHTLALGVLAYLIGSVSFAILITRLLGGIDVRDQGSGHAGATNVMRAVGWVPAIAVGLLDVGKGYLAVWIALRWGQWVWVPTLAAVMVVIGHCWPLYFRFRGGMGVGSGVGAMLAVWPLGGLLTIGLGIVCQLLIRHTARGNFAVGLLAGPMWVLLGRPMEQWMVPLLAGLVISVRAVSDWTRVYRELWLDRQR